MGEELLLKDGVLMTTVKESLENISDFVEKLLYMPKKQ
jgi:hypothetical protein